MYWNYLDLRRCNRMQPDERRNWWWKWHLFIAHPLAITKNCPVRSKTATILTDWLHGPNYSARYHANHMDGISTHWDWFALANKTPCMEFINNKNIWVLKDEVEHLLQEMWCHSDEYERKWVWNRSKWKNEERIPNSSEDEYYGRHICHVDWKVDCEHGALDSPILLTPFSFHWCDPHSATR